MRLESFAFVQVFHGTHRQTRVPLLPLGVGQQIAARTSGPAQDRNSKP